MEIPVDGPRRYISPEERKLLENNDAKWSITQKPALSRKEFQDLTAVFTAAAGRVFGTPVKVEITAWSAVPGMSAMMPMILANQMIEGEKERDEKNILVKTGNVEGVTEEAWQKASYIKVHISPVDKNAPFSYASSEFYKGAHPERLNFSIYASKKDVRPVKEEVIGKRPAGSTVGNGKEQDEEIIKAASRASSGSSESSYKHTKIYIPKIGYL